jgi:drug/metabolite transporter (DMT)-like permease
MTAADFGRLLLLAAIWGGAFPFMKVAAPALGALWTAELRVLIGGLALLAWLRWRGVDLELRRHARFYLLVGAVGLALPFALYAYAASRAPANLMSIVNATAPMFALLWSAAFGDERLTGRKLAGLAVGLAGVALIVNPLALEGGPQAHWAVAAALTACCAYGAVGVLMKRVGSGAGAQAMAAGNQLAAALVLLPLLPFTPIQQVPDALVLANIAALGLLASGVALLLYFRLVEDVGVTRALTVTYLVPLFGVLWAALFLGEALPAAALGAGLLILLGTVLVTRG